MSHLVRPLPLLPAKPRRPFLAPLDATFIARSIQPWSMSKKYQYVNGEISEQKQIPQSARDPTIPLDEILQQVQDQLLDEALKGAYKILDNPEEIFWTEGWRKFVLEDERYLFADWIFAESWE